MVVSRLEEAGAEDGSFVVEEEAGFPKSENSEVAATRCLGRLLERPCPSE